MSENLIKIQIVKTFHPLLAKGNFFEFLAACSEKNIEPVNCHISDDSESENPVGAFTIKGQREDEQDASISIETNIPQDKTKDEFYEQYFRNLSNHFKNHPAGSTAVVTNIDSKNDEITVYNVGDSESYLLMEYNGEIKTILLTRRHNIESEESIKELPENVGVNKSDKRIYAFKKNDSNKSSYVRCSLVNETEIGDRKPFLGLDELPTKNAKGMVYCVDDNGKYYIKTNGGRGEYTLDPAIAGEINVFNTIGDNGITNTWVDKTKFDLRSIAKEVFGENVDPEEIQFGTINCCDGFSEGATGYCCDYKIEKNGTITPINEEDIDPQRNISNLKKIFNEKSNNIDNKFEGSFEKYLVMSAFHGSDLQDVINKDGEIELEVKESDYPEFKELYYRGIRIGFVACENDQIGNQLLLNYKASYKPALEFNIIPNVEEQKSYNGEKSNDNITTLFYSFKLKTLESKTIGVFDGHCIRGEDVSYSAAFYLQAMNKNYSYLKDDISDKNFEKIVPLLSSLLSLKGEELEREKLENEYAIQVCLDKKNLLDKKLLTLALSNISNPKLSLSYDTILALFRTSDDDIKLKFMKGLQKSLLKKIDMGIKDTGSEGSDSINYNLENFSVQKLTSEEIKILITTTVKILEKVSYEDFNNYDARILSRLLDLTDKEKTDYNTERTTILRLMIEKSSDPKKQLEAIEKLLKESPDEKEKLILPKIIEDLKLVESDKLLEDVDKEKRMDALRFLAANFSSLGKRFEMLD